MRIGTRTLVSSHQTALIEINGPRAHRASRTLGARASANISANHGDSGSPDVCDHVTVRWVIPPGTQVSARNAARATTNCGFWNRGSYLITAVTGRLKLKTRQSVSIGPAGIRRERVGLCGGPVAFSVATSTVHRLGRAPSDQGEPDSRIGREHVSTRRWAAVKGRRTRR